MSVTIAILMVGSTFILEPKITVNLEKNVPQNYISNNRLELSAQFLAAGSIPNKPVGSLIHYKYGGAIGNDNLELEYNKRVTPGIPEDKENKFDGIWSLKAKLQD